MALNKRGVGLGERAIARELGVAPGTLIAAARRAKRANHE
jgi:hypothetical protein